MDKAFGKLSEAGGLQSMKSQRVAHDLVTKPPPPRENHAEEFSGISREMIPPRSFMLGLPWQSSG